jgi:flavin reductase (DIM6/NTAB) family NADH-FMN oxidoreductase RutF
VTRTHITPDERDPSGFYHFLNSVVVPRPIAWVSTRSKAGLDNLAPHSFFTVSAINPPVVQFTSIGRKDSQVNVEETGEFVVCFTPARLFEQINATATNFPHGVSEFDMVGLEREPSTKVAPPRVAASPVALECRLHSTQAIGISTVIMGEVIHAVIDDDALENGRPQIDRLDPIARLGANQWSEIGALRDITRIAVDDWPGHYEG